LSEQFDFGEYRDSVVSAFDSVRSSYKWLMIACASLVVFAFQSEPYKGSKKYLQDLMSKKVEIDRMSGWTEGIKSVLETTRNGALGEAISENESEKARALADLYFTLTGSDGDTRQIAEEILESRRKSTGVSESMIEKMLADELAKQYEFGVSTGLKVPFLDFVIERERFPSFVGAIVAALELILLVTMVNFRGAVGRFINAASRAGQATRAYDLLTIRWFSMFTRENPKMNAAAGWLISVAHMIPTCLVLYAIVTYWTGSSFSLKGVMLLCLLISVTASALCSIAWIKLGRTLRALSIEVRSIAA